MQKIDFQNGKYDEVHGQVVKIGHELLKKLENVQHINGVTKLRKKIGKEIKFLEKKKSDFTLKDLKTSNMNHHEYFVETLLTQKESTDVDRAFFIKYRFVPVLVNIVCENGQKWIKVITRNPNALANYPGGIVLKNIRLLSQAYDFMLAAQQNQCNFKPPQVVFYFQRKIHDDISNALREIGVEVTEGDCREIGVEGGDFQDDEVRTLNLDIGTMITYVSNLTNGSCNWFFNHAWIDSQAQRERTSPLKPVLDALFDGKMLICSESAAQTFNSIIGRSAGPEETKRAEELKERVKILPDINQLSPKIKESLLISRNVKHRSRFIFNFGYAHKAVTVSPNKHLVNAAKVSGFNIPAFIHEPNCLTEQREASAAPLSSN